MSKQYFTVQEAANQAGVSVASINNWVQRGHLASIKRYGRRLISSASLLALMEQRGSSVKSEEEAVETTAIAIRPADGPASVFNFNGMQVRTVMMEGEPWWIAKDVCEVLGLDTTVVGRGLDDDEKGLHTMQTPGGNQVTTIISEPGLYSLILRSRKPEAKAFKRWVIHEVIPAIRKTGGYGAAPQPDALTELNRFAGMMNQLMPAVAGRINELSSEINAIKEAQAKLDPQEMAQEAADLYRQHRVEMAKLDADLKRSVYKVVDTASNVQSPSDYVKKLSRHGFVWRAVHDAAQVGSMKQYETKEQYEAAIAQANYLLETITRPTLRLVM